MKTVLLLTSFVLLVGCAKEVQTNTPLSKATIPPLAAKPEVSKISKAVREVEASVDDVKSDVSKVSDKLDEIENSSGAIRREVDKAFADGLVAGSSAAGALRKFVIDLDRQLVEAKKAVAAANTNLAKTYKSLSDVKKERDDLSTSIEAISANRDTLLASLKAVNSEIDKASTRLNTAERRYATLESKYQSRAKYVWMFWTAVSLLVTFLVLRFMVAIGKLQLPI